MTKRYVLAGVLGLLGAIASASVPALPLKGENSLVAMYLLTLSLLSALSGCLIFINV